MYDVAILYTRVKFFRVGGDLIVPCEISCMLDHKGTKTRAQPFNNLL